MFLVAQVVDKQMIK